MASYEEARQRRFTLAGARVLTVLPLTVSENYAQKRVGFSPFCVCGWDPCTCPDDGPIIWIPDNDVIESRPARGGEGREDHRDIVVRGDSHIIVETHEGLPIEGFMNRSKLAGMNSVVMARSDGFWALWDATSGGFVGSIHFSASAAAQEAPHTSAGAAGHHLVPVHVTFGE